MKKARSGAKQGLQLILDQHSNLDSVATHFDADNSFKVYVGRPTVIFPKSSPDFAASFEKEWKQQMTNLHFVRVKLFSGLCNKQQSME